MFGAKRFENKNVWITGGGSGLGRNLALEFAKRGANVALSGRREQRLLSYLKLTKGRLSFISSVAGLVCYPGGAAYGASKFACRAIGLTLAQEVKREGVSVTVIYPGLVESEIGQVDRQGQFHADAPDRRPQRFMWKGEKAGRVMADAIYRRELECVFTGHGKLGAFLGKHTPGLVHLMMSRSKAAQDMYD